MGAIHIFIEDHHDLRCAACETEPVTNAHSTVLMWGQEGTCFLRLNV